MAGLEALKAQRAQTSARKMIERGAADRAGANDDDIMICHGTSPARKALERFRFTPKQTLHLSLFYRIFGRKTDFHFS